MPALLLRNCGLRPYQEIWQQMQEFTQNRQDDTADELWLVQHPAVYTQGQAGKAEHIINPSSIPLIQSDRGGQVTYHGPGQIVAYILVDLRRRKFTIRNLVDAIEKAVINLLKDYGIAGKTRCKAPGVYVEDAKICSLGLRVKKGCSYHGLALNTKMDLSPFKNINPCGYANLAVTQISEYIPGIELEKVEDLLIRHLCQELGYNGELLIKEDSNHEHSN